MKRLTLLFLAASAPAFCQLAAIPNEGFAQFRTDLNASLANGVALDGAYANPSWITSFPWAKLTGVPSFLPASTLTTLGDIGYGGATGTWTRLAGDTSNTRKFMRQLSVAGVSTAPVWDTLLVGDLPTAYPYASLSGAPSLATVATTGSASDLGAGTLPHARLPTLLSGDIPNNAANTSGTAAALTANGANCSAGSYPLGVDASGVSENCTVVLTSSTAGSSHTFAGAADIFVCTTTCTITVPVPSLGLQYCVLNSDNVSTVITLSAIGSSARYEATARTAYGTAGTGTLVSSGAAKDSVCLYGIDSTHYLTVSYNGTWVAN